MRILLGHNFYRSGSPSGEDAVYREERALLERAGHDVIVFERENDDIDGSLANRARVALEATWSADTRRSLARVIARHRPDVAHFHNTFPLLSPSAYAACRSAGIPVVQTLHNYRLICPGALLMRNGAPCESCIDGSLLTAVAHGCYRRSRLATAAVATMLSLHRLNGTYRHAVHRYIALTTFARERFIRGGLPAERIVVRPNCLMDAPVRGTGAGGYALYVGRLSEEKGVRTLVDAWRELDLPLRIAGDGALRGELEACARASGAPIEFLGFRPRSNILTLMQNATFVVIPSECYEGFPVTVLEALATGTPLLVAAIGALDELVVAPRHGCKFTPRDPLSLRDGVRQMLADRTALAAMRIANRQLFDTAYAPERALSSLMAIYQDAVTLRRQRRGWGIVG